MAQLASEYWRCYAHREEVNRSDNLRQEATILSGGTDIHLDIYPQATLNAPVLILNHALAGYCRLMIPLVLQFYDAGYCVVLADQKGQGFSGGRRGDYTIAECVQNIVDTGLWARQRFNESIFMAGASAGGTLSYYAAAQGAPVKAIAVLNLFDFGTPDVAQQAAGNAALVDSMMRFIPLLSLVGSMRIPLNWMVKSDEESDPQTAEWQALWKKDPIANQPVTFRALASYVTTPPTIAFEQNTIPILVLNTDSDKFIDPAITRRNFARLGGPKKYVELPNFGHWAQQTAFWGAIVKLSDEWFRQFR